MLRLRASAALHSRRPSQPRASCVLLRGSGLHRVRSRHNDASFGYDPLFQKLLVAPQFFLGERRSQDLSCAFRRPRRKAPSKSSLRTAAPACRRGPSGSSGGAAVAPRRKRERRPRSGDRPGRARRLRSDNRFLAFGSRRVARVGHPARTRRAVERRRQNCSGNWSRHTLDAKDWRCSPLRILECGKPASKFDVCSQPKNESIRDRAPS